MSDGRRFLSVENVPDHDIIEKRSQAAIVAIAPVVLLAGFVLHPYIGLGPPDQTAVATAVADHQTRWGAAHLVTGVGSGLLVLAFLAIRVQLRENSPERWSARGIPFIVMGSALYTFLPGMEFAPLAAAETGADVKGAAESLVAWFVPIHVIGALAFGAGVLAFRRGLADSGYLQGRTWQLVDCALVVMVVARVVPLAGVQFYVQGVAGVAALWPLAAAMRAAAVHRSATNPLPVSSP